MAGHPKQTDERCFLARLDGCVPYTGSHMLSVSWQLQEVCPDPEAGNEWQSSSTFLRVCEAHKRLAASIRSEHMIMRDAHLAFRQVLDSHSRPGPAFRKMKGCEIKEYQACR